MQDENKAYFVLIFFNRAKKGGVVLLEELSLILRHIVCSDIYRIRIKPAAPNLSARQNLLKSATISKSIIGEVEESPAEKLRSLHGRLRSLQMIAI